MVKTKGIARWTAAFGLGLAIVAGLVLIAAGPGYRVGWWPLDTGFALVTYGLLIGLASISLSVAALMLSWYVVSTRGRIYGLAGVIVALVVAYVPYHWYLLERDSPPIHDIVTDPEHPLAFDKLAATRATHQNSVAYGGTEVAQMQHDAYPDIAPLISEQPASAAFAAVMEVVSDANWDVANVDTDDMTVEATDQSFWFGLKDDIIVKVTSAGAGSRIDMRSQSRIRIGDAGTNARRVRQVLLALKKQLKN